jgi:hypothetical protein
MDDFEKITPKRRKEIADDLEKDIKGFMSTASFDPAGLLTSTISELGSPGEDEYELFDYEEKLTEIRKYTKDTIKMLAKYHLNGYEDVSPKLIERIIEDHVESMSMYDFLVWHSHRTLIDVSNEIDKGAKDSRLYEASNKIKKELRDTLKMRSDEFKNLKKFYAELRDELQRTNGKSDEDKVDGYEIILTGKPTFGADKEVKILTTIDEILMSKAKLMKDEMKKEEVPGGVDTGYVGIDESVSPKGETDEVYDEE